MSESVPAGWYPTPDGKQKYWDGERWTNLPWDEKEPAIATAAPASKTRLPRKKLFLMVGGSLLVLLAVGGGLAIKSSLDAQSAAVAAAAAQEAQDKKDADAQAAQDKKDADERAARKQAVTGIETSVKTMAEGHASTGTIDGPILSASCSPVGGGSTDDLTEQTTVFECFVANKDNGDGTMSGYYYNATMNWSSGSYTYGLGRP